MLSFYRTLTWLAHPLLRLWLLWRQHKGKEEVGRLAERYGYGSAPRGEGTLVWIHAASMGEATSALPLVRPLLDMSADTRVLFTTGTVTSAQMVAQKLPPRAIHQYIPLDMPLAVSRFMRYWKPSLALWVESELWPNLILEAHNSGCKLVSINSRMSERSFRRWKLFPHAIRRLLCCFSALFPQSEEDAARLSALGAQGIGAIGNMKYDAAALECDGDALQEIGQKLAGRTVWVAASTHPGEEEQIARTHKILSQHYPALLTILIPRHALRGDDISQQLSALGLNVAQRSLGDTISADTAFYLADTMGELGLFYRLTSTAFIGGSLVPHGGQNVLEAIRLGVVPICGPYTHNFQRICQSLEAEKALLRVTDADTLASSLQYLFSSPEALAAARQSGSSFIAAHRGISQTILAFVAPHIGNKAG